VTGWLWLDPAVSLVIAAVIVWGTWDLLRTSFDLAINAAPREVDLAGVRTLLSRLPGVTSVHDLHVWPVSTTETALTAHLVMPAGCPGDDFLTDAAVLLAREHDIGHVTLQVERDGTHCPLAPESVV
jgi:cobalt-zinc-cadmium efflux system protein